MANARDGFLPKGPQECVLHRHIAQPAIQVFIDEGVVQPAFFGNIRERGVEHVVHVGRSRLGDEHGAVMARCVAEQVVPVGHDLIVAVQHLRPRADKQDVAGFVAQGGFAMVRLRRQVVFRDRRGRIRVEVQPMARSRSVEKQPNIGFVARSAGPDGQVLWGRPRGARGTRRRQLDGVAPGFFKRERGVHFRRHGLPVHVPLECRRS